MTIRNPYDASKGGFPELKSTYNKETERHAEIYRRAFYNMWVQPWTEEPCRTRKNSHTLEEKLSRTKS